MGNEDFKLPKDDGLAEAAGIKPKGVVNKIKTMSPKGKIKVRATATGYIFNIRRKAGDVFELTEEAQFSKNWMEKI